jgi:MFS transporter, DHA1 family, multidrug resistance protein
MTTDVPPGMNSPGMPSRGIPPAGLGFTAVLGALALLPSISIDMIAPTLPSLQQALSASPTAAALTVTLFMLGFAAGQLGAGAWSDHYGRKPVLLTGLTAFVLAGLASALAPSVGALLASRTLQGGGAGAGTVLAFAMIRDLFIGDEARARRSYVLVVFSLGPMIAPSLGGLVLHLLGWRAVYGVLPVAGAVLLAVVAAGIPESRPRQPDSLSPSLGDIARAYRSVLSHPVFALATFVNACTFASMFAFVSGSPFIFIGNLGLSPSDYGLLFACTAGGLMAGSFVSGRMSGRGVDPDMLSRAALAGGALSAFALAMAGPSPVPMAGALLVAHLFCRGLVGPSLQHIALEPMGRMAGVASAALGVTQILAGAGASAIVAALLPWIGGHAMTLVMTVLSLVALAAWTLWKRVPS